MTLEPNQIICGDSLEVMKDIEDKSAQMVLADPPYGITACEWDIVPDLDKMWIELKRIGKPNCAYVFTASQPFTTDLINSNRKMFKYEWIWNKDRASNRINAITQPLRNHESVLIFYDLQSTYNPHMQRYGEPSHSVGKAKNRKLKKSTIGECNLTEGNTIDNIKYPRTIIKFPLPHPPIHPTQKPVALFEYLIRTYTNEGDLILDPFSGSCTTAVACYNTNRNYICIEQLEKYCEIGRQRVKDAQRQIKLPLEFKS